jgi:hypothetical protein
MVDVEEILRNAYEEQDEEDQSMTFEERLENIRTQLASSTIPPFSHQSQPLSLVSFSCWLQDIGYPPEVYMPHQQSDTRELKERWIGWATQWVEPK